MDNKSVSKTFSKLSFATAIFTTGLSTYFFLSFPKRILLSEGIPQIFAILTITIGISCLLGIVMMTLSFVKKEPSTWFKWIGGILNSLFLLILIASIFFARYIDAQKSQGSLPETSAFYSSKTLSEDLSIKSKRSN